MAHPRNNPFIPADLLFSFVSAGGPSPLPVTVDKAAVTQRERASSSVGDSAKQLAAREHALSPKPSPAKTAHAKRTSLLAAWPSPETFTWAPSELNDGPEPAHLEHTQERTEVGEVLLAGAADGLFFRPEGRRREYWVAFSKMRSLSLTRPLALLAPPSRVAALLNRYQITWKDGAVQQGESIGAVHTDTALFLFPPAQGSAVTRVLVPATRVQGFEWLDSARSSTRLALEGSFSPVTKPVAAEAQARALTSVSELLQALEALGRNPIRRLGEVLVELGILTSAQLEHALACQHLEHNRFGKHALLGEVLLRTGVVKPGQLKAVLAQKLGIPRVDVRNFVPDPQVLGVIPPALCHRYGLMPLCLDPLGRIVVAMDDPLSSEALEAVRFSSGRRPVAVLGTLSNFSKAIDPRNGRASCPSPEANKLAAPDADLDVAVQGRGEFDLLDVQELTSRLTREAPLESEIGDADIVSECDSTLVRLVNKIILDALQSGASDIHIESTGGHRPTRIRMRHDGVLSDYTEVPARFRSALISRIKVMAHLDIAERRKHQDGKIDFSRFGPTKLELRVVVIPTVNGLESVILRLLSSSVPTPVQKLGLSNDVLTQLRQLVEKPHGLLLVCGPTGSGKTTTLHSLLSLINTPERKIWTAEDPVEITQDGLSQIQVNPKIGWTFAEALRSLLRADPDVIMIGEMRDRETAQTAVEAALTGHLVLSTLHTNSAPETVTRLLDLGIDPFKFGDSLLGVLAQRLVRRVCPKCSKAVELGEEDVRRIAHEYTEGTALDPMTALADWRARLGHGGRLFLATGTGCEECNGSGYKGRVGLYEFMRISSPLRKLIHRRSEADAARKLAAIEGMRTLVQDGIEKSLLGVTTLQQVRAACG